MSVIEFNFQSRKKLEFTAQEKTELGDIAMGYREQGLPVRLYLMKNSNTPVAKLFNSVTGEEYIFITKHRDSAEFSYKFTTSKTCGEFVNFSDVLQTSRQYIENLHGQKINNNVFLMQNFRNG